MPDNVCSKCQSEQYSVMDKAYLKQNSQCWLCDKKEWTAGNLSTEEFERRERLAAQVEEESSGSNPAL